MKHIVKLSNGAEIHLIENDGSLSIANGDKGVVEWYICEIKPYGVLVYPNSGDACECAVSSLVRRAE